MITVRVNGAAAWVLPTTSWSPVAFEAKVEHDGLWVEPERLGVGETARVGRGQAQLEIRGVLVIRRGEGAAGDARERLDRVLMAVRRAVLHDKLPAERAGRQRPLFRVGCRAGEGDDVSDPPGRPAAGVAIVADGAELPTLTVTGSLTLEAPAASVTRSRTTCSPVVENVAVGCAAVESSYSPSSSRSQA